jgi:hypothetical protein
VYGTASNIMYGTIHTITLKVYTKASKSMNIDEQIWDNVVNRTEKIWRELESIYDDDVGYGVQDKIDKIRDNVSMIAWDSVKRNVWQNVKRQYKSIK